MDTMEFKFEVTIDNNRYYDENKEFYYTFLQANENWINDALQVKGYTFLNEVLDRLGIPPIREGQLVGWQHRRVEFDTQELENSMIIRLHPERNILDLLPQSDVTMVQL